MSLAREKDSVQSTGAARTVLQRILEAVMDLSNTVKEFTEKLVLGDDGKMRKGKQKRPRPCELH